MYPSFVAFFLIILALCNAQEFDLTKHLGTRSPYPVPTSVQPDKIDPQQCPGGSLVFVNFLARHGARYPTKKNGAEIVSMINTLKTLNISNNLYTWLKTYNLTYGTNLDGNLAPRGETVHYQLSKRFLQRFGPFFNAEEFTPETYPIQTTTVSRASRSGNTFGFGLFEGDGTLGLSKYLSAFSYTNGPKDIELRFFDNCKSYNTTEISQTINSLFSSCFISNLRMVAFRVASRLGDSSQADRILPYVINIVDACAFDIVLQNTTSLFCSLLDETDYQITEYISDIKDYYLSGYGTNIAYQISSPLLASFFQQFDLHITSKTDNKAYLRFAHAETVMPFAAILGLYKDSVPLKCETDFDADRQWRSSVISPFAANIAMLLYNCADGYKVKLLANEQEEYFPNCQGQLYCPLESLKMFYNDSIYWAQNNWNSECN